MISYFGSSNDWYIGRKAYVRCSNNHAIISGGKSENMSVTLKYNRYHQPVLAAAHPSIQSLLVPIHESLLASPDQPQRNV